MDSVALMTEITKTLSVFTVGDHCSDAIDVHVKECVPWYRGTTLVAPQAVQAYGL